MIQEPVEKKYRKCRGSWGPPLPALDHRGSGSHKKSGIPDKYRKLASLYMVFINVEHLKLNILISYVFIEENNNIVAIYLEESGTDDWNK